MSLLIGWDSICRICLKEGTLSPIFDGEEDVSAKIMLCSSIEVGYCINIDLFVTILTLCVATRANGSVFFMDLYI